MDGCFDEKETDVNNIQSIALYFTVFLFSYVLIRFGLSSKSRLLISLGLGIVIALGALRYGVGIDYASYLELYGYHGQGIELNSQASYHAAMIEPMFIWLAQISYGLTGTPLLYFGLPWAATTILVYLGVKSFLPKSTPDQIALAWFTLLPIITALGFNQVRQTLAAAILFFAYKFLVKPKTLNIIKYLLLSAVALTAHFSAVFIAVLLLLATKFNTKDYNFKRRIRSLIWGSISSVYALILLSLTFKDVLLESFAEVKYIREYYRLLVVDSDISGLLFGVISIRPENLIVLFIFLVPIVLFLKGKYTGNNKILLVCALGLILSSLSLFMTNGERLSQYLIFFAPIAVWGMAETKYKVKIFYSSAIFAIIMIFGWQSVTHYSSIFSRDVDLNVIAQRRIRPLHSQVMCIVKYGECNDMNLYDADTSRDWINYGRDDLWRLK